MSGMTEAQEDHRARCIDLWLHVFQVNYGNARASDYGVVKRGDNAARFASESAWEAVAEFDKANAKINRLVCGLLKEDQ